MDYTTKGQRHYDMFGPSYEDTHCAVVQTDLKKVSGSFPSPLSEAPHSCKKWCDWFQRALWAGLYPAILRSLGQRKAHVFMAHIKPCTGSVAKIWLHLLREHCQREVNSRWSNGCGNHVGLLRQLSHQIPHPAMHFVILNLWGRKAFLKTHMSTLSLSKDKPFHGQSALVL